MRCRWGLLGVDMLNLLGNQQTWPTREELHSEIVFWIEHTYNRRRRQSGLGKLTPVEFELAFAPHATTTAA